MIVCRAIVIMSHYFTRGFPFINCLHRSRTTFQEPQSSATSHVVVNRALVASPSIHLHSRNSRLQSPIEGTQIPWEDCSIDFINRSSSVSGWSHESSAAANWPRWKFRWFASPKQRGAMFIWKVFMGEQNLAIFQTHTGRERTRRQ